MARTVLTPVTLPADPTAALQAATKQYVDALPAATPLNAFAIPTANVAMNGFLIVNVGAATGGLHAMNRNASDGRYPQLATVTTKGDLYVATASGTVARQGVGANGTHLIADSSQTNGVAWGSSPLVFASTAARDAAITAPTAGMTCITTDTGSFWQYFTTQGWYRPFSVLNRTLFTSNVGGITTSGTTLMTTASLTIPAGRRIGVVGHIYGTFLSNGGWIWAYMDGATYGGATLAQMDTYSGGLTLHGEQSGTPAAGSHTFAINMVAASGTVNARGDLSNGYIEVRDLGAA